MSGPQGGAAAGTFASRIIEWQHLAGRHDLPWQRRSDAYAVWVSEIMLQQTQVATVIPYYERFIAEFPDVEALARAPLERVLEHWSGLGYYSRARNLHRCAQEVTQHHGGEFPSTAEALEALPGIGRSTAAAIRSLAFGIPAAILDGNVKRVVARHFGVSGYPGDPSVQRELWAIAEAQLPPGDAAAYTQGLMDLGASRCARRRPDCAGCPVSASCQARLQARIEEIPAPRPRSELRRRHVVMLLVWRGREVLLERRPPTGIWGGLWSLPELVITADEFEGAEPATDTQAQIGRWLSREGLSPLRTDWLPGFEHLFTHQRLAVLPAAVQVESGEATTPQVGEPQRVWTSLEACAQAALPQPVKALLLRAPFAARGTA